MTGFIALVAGLLVGMAVAAVVLRTWEGRRAARMLDTWRAEESEKLAAASIRRSRAVVRGQVTEQVTPFLDGFPWDPADARFLGKPVDYIVFDGYSEVCAGLRDVLREVVFVDVKSGHSGLSKIERRVKACVQARRVRFMVAPMTERSPRRRSVGR